MTVNDLITALLAFQNLDHHPDPLPLGIERMDTISLGEALRELSQDYARDTPVEEALLRLLRSREEIQLQKVFKDRGLGSENLVGLLGFTCSLLDQKKVYHLHTILMLRRELSERLEADFQPDEMGHDAISQG
ncbi:MAG: hypothetical protein WA057_03760, partial [Candidatus Magasanikiibacteriota bacterium]